MPKSILTTDPESVAIVSIYRQLSALGFDAQWRVLNYVLVRLWGRTWSLSRPKSDTT